MNSELEQSGGILIYAKQVATENYFFVEALLNAARKAKIPLRLIYAEDISLGVVNHNLSLLHPSLDFSAVRFAIMRTRVPLLYHQLEAKGIRCFNAGHVADIAEDKARTHQVVSALGIPTTNTRFITPGTFLGIPDGFTFPIILKEVSGGQGKKVYCCSTTEELSRYLEAKPESTFIIQNFIAPGGLDLRITMLGNSVLGATLRKSEASFKANISQGGTPHVYTLPSAQIKTAQKIASALNSDLLGIDFLINEQQELLFNEINNVVGVQGLYATTNIDVAAEYLHYIKNAPGI